MDRSRLQGSSVLFERVANRYQIENGSNVVRANFVRNPGNDTEVDFDDSSLSGEGLPSREAVVERLSDSGMIYFLESRDCSEPFHGIF